MAHTRTLTHSLVLFPCSLSLTLDCVSLHTNLLALSQVHVRSGSARVRAGQAVVAGQLLAESGHAGFCPVPHLHLQCHGSAAADAHTVRFALRDRAGQPYFPTCGTMYNPD